MNYGILNVGTRTLTTYGNISTAHFAELLVKNAMREEDCTSMARYLQGWVESLNECRNGEGEPYTLADVPVQASDNLVYGNAHYYNGKKPLTSLEKGELCSAVETYLEEFLK